MGTPLRRTRFHDVNSRLPSVDDLPPDNDPTAGIADPRDSLDHDHPDDSAQPHLVRDNLRALGADLTDAMSASRRDDWAAALQPVRMIQGRAAITRGLLERMLGQDATATEPPLVRVFREIRGLISDQEIGSLPPDELRARMRGVLQALDRELKAVLSPPDEPSTP